MAVTNACPCCGLPLAFVGVQEYPAKYGLTNKVIVECTNIDCEMYLDTGTAEGLAESWKECEKRRETET